MTKRASHHMEICLWSFASEIRSIPDIMRLNFHVPLVSRYVEAQVHTSACFPEFLIRQLVTTICIHSSVPSPRNHTEAS